MAIRITTRRRTVSEDNLIEKDGIMISTPLVEGFDEVYKRNYTRLSQYAFHIIHDKGDAEDLANEAFLVYYQHADEMDIENPDAYLFKILRNLIGNYIKRRDLHPTLSQSGVQTGVQAELSLSGSGMPEIQSEKKQEEEVSLQT